jgi:predicted lipid-binding transport protein (Tim44 family)
MPSDPVKAVVWFVHWSLKVVVRFCWIPIIVMVAYETYINGAVGGIFNGFVEGIITLLVGLGVWALLYVLLLCLDISTGISRVISEVGRMQRPTSSRNPFRPFADAGPESTIVEGTITDLEEERKKRRSE